MLTAFRIQKIFKGSILSLKIFMDDVFMDDVNAKKHNSEGHLILYCGWELDMKPKPERSRGVCHHRCRYGMVTVFSTLAFLLRRKLQFNSELRHFSGITCTGWGCNYSFMGPVVHET